MTDTLRVYRVFIASPNDLAPERSALKKCVEELNGAFRDSGWRIDLLAWENVRPNAGRPQEIINELLDRANLFIGCVWKRWGSPSGNGDKTGFQEEFERALDRNGRDKSFEVCLYFKKIHQTAAAARDAQLESVDRFRKRIQSEHIAFFREFGTLRQWEAAMRELLIVSFVKALKRANQVSTDQALAKDSTLNSKVTIPDPTGIKEEAGGESDSSRQRIAELVGNVTGKSSNVGKKERPAPLNDQEIATCLMFYSAANFDSQLHSIELGVRELASLYGMRAKVKLDPTQCRFLLRTILLDISNTKPGWYWLRRCRGKVAVWLILSTYSGADDWTRGRIINAATALKFSLPSLLKPDAAHEYVDRLLKQGSKWVTNALLEHLMEFGETRYLSQIQTLVHDSDDEIRGKAVRVCQALRIKLDPESEFKNLTNVEFAADPDLLTLIRAQMPSVSVSCLRRAATAENGPLRSLAATELLTRGLVDEKLAQRFQLDSLASVRECGFIAAVTLGTALDLAEVRSRLRSKYSILGGSEWEKADVEKVILAYFDRLDDSALWPRVAALDQDSHLALRRICSRGDGSAMEKVRRLLHDPKGLRQDLIGIEWPPADEPLNVFGRLLNPTVADRLSAVVAEALSAVSCRALPEDRELFLKYLAPAYAQINAEAACMRGLSHVGESQDASEIARILSVSSSDRIRAYAARAFMILSRSRDKAARHLLSLGSDQLAAVVFRFCGGRHSVLLWPIVKELLWSENEKSRRSASYCALRVLPPRELATLLNGYQNKSYFYDVVALLDRFVYSKGFLRQRFLEEEQRRFEESWTWDDWPWPVRKRSSRS